MLLVFVDCDDASLGILSDIGDYTLPILLTILVEVVVVVAEISEHVAVDCDGASEDEPDVIGPAVVVDLD